MRARARPGQACPLVTFLVLPPPTAGSSSTSLGAMPDPASLPPLPSFDPADGSSSGLGVLAAAAAASERHDGRSGDSDPAPPVSAALQAAGPYNPASTLPPKVVKRILALEFVEMSELRGDIWSEDATASDHNVTPRRSAKPLVNSIRTWLECYARMASILTTRFPEKAPELWAYQSTILKAAHNYEGSNWVAYDRQFRREMLARRDLNWSATNTRLYNEAFTGRARTIPRCPHCLSKDHGGASCPHNPNPPILGWLQPPMPVQWVQPSQFQPSPAAAPRPAPAREVCRSYNMNRCRFSRCRFAHVCSECGGAHAAPSCPSPRQFPDRGPAPRGRPSPRVRQNQAHPYLPAPGGSAPEQPQPRL